MGDNEGLDKQLNSAPEWDAKPLISDKPSEQVRCSPRVKPGSGTPGVGARGSVAPGGELTAIQKIKSARLAELRSKNEKEKDKEKIVKTDNRLGTSRKPTGIDFFVQKKEIIFLRIEFGACTF